MSARTLVVCMALAAAGFLAATRVAGDDERGKLVISPVVPHHKPLAKALPGRPIPAARALALARTAVDSTWQLLALSTTGEILTGVAHSGFKTSGVRWLRPDGTAGQWVVEFVRNPPRPIVVEGKAGFQYPCRSFVVTSFGPEGFPPDSVKVPARVTPLTIGGFERALRTAMPELRKQGKPFQRLTTAAWPGPGGAYFWVFEARDTSSVDRVAVTRVSQDGARILR